MSSSGKDFSIILSFFFRWGRRGRWNCAPYLFSCFLLFLSLDSCFLSHLQLKEILLFKMFPIFRLLFSLNLIPVKLSLRSIVGNCSRQCHQSCLRYFKAEFSFYATDHCDLTAFLSIFPFLKFQFPIYFWNFSTLLVVLSQISSPVFPPLPLFQCFWCVFLVLFSSSVTDYAITSNLTSLSTVHMLKTTKCISLHQTPL